MREGERERGEERTTTHGTVLPRLDLGIQTCCSRSRSRFLGVGFDNPTTRLRLQPQGKRNLTLNRPTIRWIHQCTRYISYCTNRERESHEREVEARGSADPGTGIGDMETGMPVKGEELLNERG